VAFGGHHPDGLHANVAKNLGGRIGGCVDVCSVFGERRYRRIFKQFFQVFYKPGAVLLSILESLIAMSGHIHPLY
jgi:hypothetical protein